MLAKTITKLQRVGGSEQEQEQEPELGGEFRMSRVLGVLQRKREYSLRLAVWSFALQELCAELRMGYSEALWLAAPLAALHLLPVVSVSDVQIQVEGST